MKVIAITSSKTFKFSGPRANQEEPERPHDQPTDNETKTIFDLAVLLGGLAVTAWLPTLIWCLVLDHPLPAYLISSSEIFGAMLGALFYAAAAPTALSCVPVTSKRVTQHGGKLKKAA
jgi:hypothetical protein